MKIIMVLVALAGSAYVWNKGWIQNLAGDSGAGAEVAQVRGSRPVQPVEQPNQNWQTGSSSGPASGAPSMPGFATPPNFKQGGSSSLDEQCRRARANVEVAQSWMKDGGQVYVKGSGKKLNETDTFDAVAKNRQFIEENCRNR
jgi:hypothetical protein